VVVGEPVHHQKQRLGDEGEPAEVDHLLQLRVDLLQNVQVLWADEKGHAVDTVATHGGSWEWLGGLICRRRGLIVENLELGRSGAWQKHGGEVSVLDSGEGKRSREGDWSVLGLFPFGGDELAGGRIVVDTVLRRYRTRDRHISESAAPFEQMRNRYAAVGHFGRYLRLVAVPGEVKCFPGVQLAIGEFKADLEAIVRSFHFVQDVVQVDRRLLVLEAQREWKSGDGGGGGIDHFEQLAARILVLLE